MVDLNSLVLPGSSFFLYWAPFIDDHGQIAAFGALPNGESHAVLLTPCHENHPGIEGYDYNEVEQSASAIGVGARPVAQSARTANPWVSTSSTLRSLGRRSMPWYRNFGVQAQPK